jgi:CRP/FNR family transcriptional regulator
MLRKSTQIYNDRWVAQSRHTFKTEPQAETVLLHRDRYWQAVVRAVETSDFDELMVFAREAGRFQASRGYDLADAVRRTVEATNLIELSLLESNDDIVPPIDIINEIAELRSMIVMAVAEGYKEDEDAKQNVKRNGINSKDRLRAVLERKIKSFTSIDLKNGDEIPPLYDDDMRLHFVDRGTLRLYNLLPNGRCITISILEAGDVFLQWRAGSQSISCLCAEAMQDSRVITASGSQMADIVAEQPVAAIDMITGFARRMTESQVLIEDLMNNSVNLRLYRTLLELSKQFGKPDGAGSLIDYPLTHQRLADMIGSNRVTVTRKLHDLQERGIVETRRNATIVLLDSNALASLAESGAAE